MRLESLNFHDRILKMWRGVDAWFIAHDYCLDAVLKWRLWAHGKCNVVTTPRLFGTMRLQITGNSHSSFGTHISPRKPSKQEVHVGLGLNIEAGEAVWQFLLIFDNIPLPTLTYSSTTKNICSRLRCVFMARCVCMWQRKDAALIQLCTRRKKPASLLLSLAALTEHQRNKTPADTTVISAREETTSDLHFYPSEKDTSVPKTQEGAHSGCLVAIK